VSDKSKPHFHSGGVVGLRANEVPAILSTGQEFTREEYERYKLRYQSARANLAEVTVVNIIDPEKIRAHLDDPDRKATLNRILSSGMHNRQLARGIVRSIEEQRIAIQKACEREAEVRKNDVLFLHDGHRVLVCRVQDSPALKTYVCTNGERTFFVLESEIGSHQHYRDGVLVLDIVRELRRQMETV
jgi:hypothetical protein